MVHSLVKSYSQPKQAIFRLLQTWIGKTYEPERWIDYHEPRACLNQYLLDIRTKYSKDTPMDKNAQDAFKKHCFEASV